MLTHYLPLFLNRGTHFCCCTHVSDTYNTFSLICNTYQLPLSTRIRFWTSGPVFEYFEPVFEPIAHSIPTTALSDLYHLFFDLHYSFSRILPIFNPYHLPLSYITYFHTYHQFSPIFYLFLTSLTQFSTYSHILEPLFTFFKPFHSFFDFCLPIFVPFTYLIMILIFFNCFRALPHVGRVPKYCQLFVNFTTCLDTLPIIIINCLQPP